MNLSMEIMEFAKAKIWHISRQALGEGLMIQSASKFLVSFFKAKHPLGHHSTYEDGSVWVKVSDTGKKKLDWKMVSPPTKKKKAKKGGKKSNAGIKQRPPRSTGRKGTLPGTEPVGAGVSDKEIEPGLKGGRRTGHAGKSEIIRGDPRIRLGGNLRGGLTETEQRNLNHKILSLVAAKGPEGSYSPEEKEMLKHYTGAGASLIKGSGVKVDPMSRVSAFFTPDRIVRTMWSIVNKYIGKGSRILEPSSGVGRFADQAGMHKVDMIEIDGVTATINKILHPDETVVKGHFEQLFFNEARPKEYSGPVYDGVVGNPPYNPFSLSQYSRVTPKADKAATYYEYFINKSLDTVRPGGIVSMIVPSTFLRASGSPIQKKIREQIAKKSRLVEAYRLPTEGVFHGSDIGTDILVFRKDASGMDASLLEHDNWYRSHPDNIAAEQVTDPATGIPYIKGTKTPDRTQKPVLDRYRKPYPGGYLVGNLDDSMNKVDELSRKIEAPVDPHTASSFASQEIRETLSEAMMGNKNAAGPHVKTPRSKQAEIVKPPTANVETYSLDEFTAQYGLSFTKDDMEIWKHVQHDGSLPQDIKFEPARMSYVGGKIFPDASYGSGKVYEKLDALEGDKDYIDANYGPNQYDKQKKLLMSVIPPKKTVKDITISPISSFGQNFKFSDDSSLIARFYDWAGVSTSSWGSGRRRRESVSFNGNISDYEFRAAGIAWSDVVEYIAQVPVRASGGSTPDEQAASQAEATRRRRKRRDMAEELFTRFVREGIAEEDRETLEGEFNKVFNGYAHMDYKKIPVFIDGMSKRFKDADLVLRSIQIEGIAFAGQKGTGIIAYGTGAGKTLTGICATVQAIQRGWAKRPIVVVPKAVYAKWIREIRMIFPHLEVNELGNMGKFDLGKTPIKDGSLSIMTYEGLATMKVKEDSQTFATIIDDVKDAITEKKQKPDEHTAAGDTAGAKGIDETTAGAGTEATARARVFATLFKDGVHDWDELGFDYLCVDEAHRAKNVFGRAKVKKDKGEKGQKANEFGKLAGGESSRGLRAFIFSRLVQEKNNGRNTLMLTATPFTNSPLEIYNMLALVAKKRLKEMGIDNLYDFLGMFAKIKTESGVNFKNEIKSIDVVKEFHNLTALQGLVREYIDFRSIDDIPDIKVLRPRMNQHMLKNPPTLKMSPEQERIRGRAEILYSDKDVQGGILKAIHAQRTSNLSPKLLQEMPEFADMGLGSLNFVTSSPKLKFTADVISNLIKKYPQVGHVISVPRGIDYYPEIIEYFKNKGIPANKIDTISSKTSESKVEKIIADFNNPDHPLKILIGSDTINEGVDLNGNSATLWNLMQDYNPAGTIQKTGRVYRPGNIQPEVAIGTPLIADSVDSAMYQKHDEKMRRFSDVWSYKNTEASGDTFNVEDINPEELKFDLIRDPEKRARMRIQDEQKNLEAQYHELMRQSEDWKKTGERIKLAKSTIEISQDEITEHAEEMRKHESGEEPISDYWLEKMPGKLKEFKKVLKNSQKDYEVLMAKMSQYGVTVDTVDQFVTELETKADGVRAEHSKIGDKLPQYITAEIASEKARPRAKDVDVAVREYSDYLLGMLKRNSEEIKQRDLQKSQADYIVDSARTIPERHRIEFIKSESQIITDGLVRTYMVRRAFARHIVPIEDIGRAKKLFILDEDAIRAISQVEAILDRR